jgi:hypothetical protein
LSGSSLTTSPMLLRAACRVAHRRLLRLRCAARRRLLHLHSMFGCFGTSRGLSRGSSSTTSLTLRVLVPRHVARLVVDYFAHAARPGASAHRASRHVPRLTARRRLLRLRRASGCLGMSRGSLSTTSPTPCILVLRHITRLVAWLIVDYFAYAARPGASARRAAHRRLLRLCRFAWLVTWLIVHYFAYATRPGASARRAAHRRLLRLCRFMRLVAWLIVDYFAYAARPGASVRCTARRRLLRLHRASGCFGTSHGLSRGSSSTTSLTLHVLVPRHVARLVIDYFAYAARPGASARRVARHLARRRLLRAP